MIRVLTGAAALALLGACTSEPVRNVQTTMESLFQSSKGEPALAAGLKQYEDGQYASCRKQSFAARVRLDIGHVASHADFAVITDQRRASAADLQLDVFQNVLGSAGRYDTGHRLLPDPITVLRSEPGNDSVNA